MLGNFIFLYNEDRKIHSKMTLEEKKDLWKKILTALEPQMRSSDFRTWLSNTVIITLEHDKLTVGCPSDIVRTQLAAKYHQLLLKAAQGVEPNIAFIDYEVDNSLADGGDRVVSLGTITGVIKRALRKEQVEGVRVADGLTTRMLNPEYTFENFVVGAEDRIALAAAQAVADRPGKAYNPLFIYGGVGLGKTHLLQAIGNQILKKDRNKMVIYTTSEKFTNDVISAIRGGVKKIDKFRAQYRKVDVLIVDDIQFLAGKKSTMEEFFHTFNVLHEAGKQIVIAADRPPRELVGLDDRLVSRFQSGMIADVYIPNLETRIAIVQEFVAREKILLSSEIVELVAKSVKTSIRDLRGIVTQIAARVRLSEQSSDRELWAPTRENIIDVLVRSGNAVVTQVNVQQSIPVESLTCDDFVRAAADYFQLNATEIVGESRKKELAHARSLAMWLARSELNFGFEKIGHAFGNRNHTTVMHSVRKIQEEIDQEPNGVTLEQLRALKAKALGAN